MTVFKLNIKQKNKSSKELLFLIIKSRMSFLNKCRLYYKEKGT